MRLRLVNTATSRSSRLRADVHVRRAARPGAAGVPRRAALGLPRRRPAGRLVLAPGECGSSTATCGHRPRHANDGPASAFVTLADGTIDVATGSTRRVVVGAARRRRTTPCGSGRGALGAVAARDGRLHPYRPVVLGRPGSARSPRRSSTPSGRRLPADARGAGWASTRLGRAVEQAMTTLARAARADDAGLAGVRGAARVARAARRPRRQFLPRWTSSG